MMAFGYRYTLETQENGWTLVRFPGIPEALTEGASAAEARANALELRHRRARRLYEGRQAAAEIGSRA